MFKSQPSTMVNQSSYIHILQNCLKIPTSAFASHLRPSEEFLLLSSPLCYPNLSPLLHKASETFPLRSLAPVRLLSQPHLYCI